jgi:hypothetical protein
VNWLVSRFFFDKMSAGRGVYGLDTSGPFSILGVIQLIGAYMKSKKAAQTKIDATRGNEDQLARAFKQALEAAQAVRAMAPLLEQELMRYVKLQEKIEAAFGGKLFLPDQPPTSVENMRRFRAYVGMRKSVTMIIVKLIHELMRVHGVDPNHPHDMWELPTFAGGIGAAGAPVGVPPQQTSDGQPIPSGPPPGQYPAEVLRLAQQLQADAHRVKGPFDANSAAKAFSNTGKTSDDAKVH